MKTKEVLEQLRKENERVPSNVALRQSSSGEFLGFITLDNEFQNRAERITETAAEYLRAGLERIRQSKPAKL